MSKTIVIETIVDDKTIVKITITDGKVVNEERIVWKGTPSDVWKH